MTNKFDGNLWKWLLANVMGKLAPSTEEATEGQVLTVGDEGAMEWSDPSTGRDVPATSGASAGDVLTVDGEGDYGWQALPAMNSLKAWRLKLPTTVPSGSTVDITDAVKSAILDALNFSGDSATAGTIMAGMELTVGSTAYTAMSTFMQAPIVVMGPSNLPLLNVNMPLYGYNASSGIKLLGTLKMGSEGSHRIDFDSTLVAAAATLNATLVIAVVSDVPNTNYQALT